MVKKKVIRGLGEPVTTDPCLHHSCEPVSLDEYKKKKMNTI